VPGLRIGNSQAVDERGFATKLLERPAQRRASAMHDDDLMALFAQAWNRLGEFLDQFLAVERGPANLDDELHCNPAFSSKPNIRFMFCTACPAAPFKRLSMHDTSTTRAIRRKRETDVAVVRIERKLDL